jgi:AcrR family transcriptional regulator
MRHIAKYVGITAPSVYQHFKNKEEIFYFLADSIEKDMVDDFEKYLSVDYGKCLETISRYFMNRVYAIEQRRGIGYLVIAEVANMGNKKLKKRFAEVVSKYHDKVAEVIKKGVDSGELRQDVDPKTVAIALDTMMHGLVGLWALNNFSYDLVEACQPVWDMVKKSLAANQ